MYPRVLQFPNMNHVICSTCGRANLLLDTPTHDHKAPDFMEVDRFSLTLFFGLGRKSNSGCRLSFFFFLVLPFLRGVDVICQTIKWNRPQQLGELVVYDPGDVTLKFCLSCALMFATKLRMIHNKPRAQSLVTCLEGGNSWKPIETLWNVASRDLR